MEVCSFTEIEREVQNEEISFGNARLEQNLIGEDCLRGNIPE